MVLRKIKPPARRPKIPRLPISIKVQRLPKGQRPLKRHAKLVKRRRRFAGAGASAGADSGPAHRWRDSGGGHLILLEQLRGRRVNVDVVQPQDLLQHVDARLQEADVGLGRRAAAVVLAGVRAGYPAPDAPGAGGLVSVALRTVSGVRYGAGRAGLECGRGVIGVKWFRGWPTFARRRRHSWHALAAYLLRPPGTLLAIETELRVAGRRDRGRSRLAEDGQGYLCRLCHTIQLR